jgi:hypothetical protein
VGKLAFLGCAGIAIFCTSSRITSPVVYVYMFICLEEGRYQYSGYLLCCDVIEYDRRRPELSNAALYMKQDTNIIEK